MTTANTFKFLLMIRSSDNCKFELAVTDNCAPQICRTEKPPQI
jgi:hypothetical protein